MPTNEQIHAALATLDPANNDHWTGNGSPAMAAVELALGEGAVTRAEVTAAAPTFTRENPKLEAPEVADTANDQGQGTTTDPVPDEAEATVTEDEAEATVTEDEAEPLDAEIHKAEQAIAEANAMLAKGQKKLAEANAKRDALVVERERNRPRHENQHSIMAYIKTQQVMRVARAEEITAQRSALDMAMQRKTGRGTGRPAPRVPAHRMGE